MRSYHDLQRGAQTLSTVTLSPAADAGGETSIQPSRPSWIIPLAVGLLGLLCALALPFAPVLVKQATVTWPAAGTGPQSTTAFFVPYEPAELHAVVPCQVVRQALAAGLAGRRSVTVLGTTVDAGSRPGHGLAVIVGGGRTQVLVNGRRPVNVRVPPGSDCGIRIDTTSTGTAVAAGTGAPVRLAGVTPQVHAFVTELRPDQAQGMRVSARARNWFEARPTGIKIALIALQLLLAAGSLYLLGRAGRRIPKPDQPDQPDQPATATGENAKATGENAPQARPWRYAVDAAVVGTLALWTIIGPLSGDDGYATMTIRNAGDSGDIGNYYHWFNASEAPFTLLQRILQPLASVSLAPVWLRVPSVVFGIVTWFVISRGIVNAALPPMRRSTVVRALTAVAFLAWWLPYCLGIRPESLVTLGLAATYALLLRATEPERGGGLVHLGLAAAVAGLTLSVTPSGILVFAPILVLSPRIWRLLTAGLTGRGRGLLLPLAGRLAPVASAAGVGLVAMFAMQSLHGLQQATKQHNDIGPSHSWYEEYLRYDYLLGGGLMGTATKRLVVLVALALLVTMAVLIARGVRGLPGLREAHIVTAVAATAFLLLWFTPSKWSHHFGALAGLGTPFLVVAVVAVWSAARQRAADHAVLAAGLTGGGAVALAAALSFSGANTWGIDSTFGVLWATGKVSPLGLPLPNPLFWALPVIALLVVRAVRHRRGEKAGEGGARSTLAAAAAIVAVSALGTSVAVLLIGFVGAPFRQHGSYSLAAENAAHLTGSSCGITDKIEVMPDTPGGVLPPSPVAIADKPKDRPPPEDRLQSFVAGGGFLPTAQPVPAAGTGRSQFVWGSLAPGEFSTGQLASRWFQLPKLRPRQELAISVAGRTGGANALRLEFARPGGAPVSRVLSDGPAGQPGWRALAVPAAGIPAGADRVRVHAVDNSVDAGGWLAVSGPRLRDVVRLTDFLAVRGPVLPDWEIAMTVPCVRQTPTVAHGLAQAPAVLLQAPGQIGTGISYAAGQGGSFHGVLAAGSLLEVPSRMAGRPRQPWGHVVLVRYPAARDAYQVSVATVSTPGWRGDR